MQNTYVFFGGPLHNQQKTFEESELPWPVSGGVYRTTGGGHNVASAPTAYTLLFWPDREAPARPGDPIAAGEAFLLDEDHVGDCSSTQADGSGAFLAFCVLDEGHAGKHVASNGDEIVAT